MRVLTAILALTMGVPLSPTLLSAQEAGDWLIRGRVIYVAPAEDSTVNVIGGDAEADDAVVPELDFTYFFTSNIAAELILATSPHDMSVENSALGDVDLGDVWLLPPTLTLQYHFQLGDGFKPYIGAGINYTLFYGEDAPGGAVATIDYDNSIGPAFQAGIDYSVDEHWLINFDVKKIFINTDVDINGGAITADVDLDPWIFGLGVGYRF
jgi:outer membrane protein